MSLVPGRKRRKEDIEVKTIETQTELTAVETQTDTDYFEDYGSEIWDTYGPPAVPEDKGTPEHNAWKESKANAISYVEGRRLSKFHHVFLLPI